MKSVKWLKALSRKASPAVFDTFDSKNPISIYITFYTRIFTNLTQEFVKMVNQMSRLSKALWNKGFHLTDSVKKVCQTDSKPRTIEFRTVNHDQSSSSRPVKITGWPGKN